MFENMFTTKMSMDKEKLQHRFLKIRSENSKASRLMAVIVFAVIVLIMIATAIYVAVNQDNEYAMSDEDFAAYISRPIGAIMADIDYADDEKIVFHYGSGFFITDENTKEIKHKIDLSKLNCALPVQADTTLTINISKDGKYAYLTNTGLIDEAEKLDNYIINLKNGNVKTGEIPKGAEFFGDYGDIGDINAHGGWPGDRYVKHNNKAYYLLCRQYEIIGNMQLVTIDYNDNEKTDLRYIFGSEHISYAAKEKELITNALADGERITGNETNWQVGSYEVKQIVDNLSRIMQLPKPDVKDGTYKVITYPTELKGNGAPRIFIINTDTMELLLSERLDATGYAGMKEYYTELIKLLNESGHYMSNTEGLTYNSILAIQKEVDNGNYKWRLDPEQTLDTFFELSDNTIMAGGTISELTSNEFGCGGTYSHQNGASVEFELLAPLNRKGSIYIIKSITAIKQATTTTIEKVEFWDEAWKQILPDANWYSVGSKVTATLSFSGLWPESVTAYYTDSGTETEQYKKVVGKGKPSWDMTKLELTFDEDTHGHLWFVLDLGTQEIRSEIYSVTSEANMLSAILIEDKSFETQDLDNIQDIRVVAGGKIYQAIGSTALAKAKQMLSGAKPIKGGSGCPFDAVVIIYNKNWEKSKVELATDSCAVFKSGDIYYDYSDGDNSEFYSLFGIYEHIR